YYTTVKYGPDGDILWKQDFDMQEHIDVIGDAIKMAVDNYGAVYITDCVGRDGDIADWMLIKYTPDGQQDWMRYYAGPGGDIDNPSAITLDQRGNIYVTGKQNAAGHQWNGLTKKYTPEGEEEWSSEYESGGWDEGLAIAVDDLGNVYVGAVAAGFQTDDDLVTLKYDANGQFQWFKRYNGGGDAWTDDWPVAIQMDSQGNVVVSGISEPEPGIRHGIVTIKYTPSGEELWLERYEKSSVLDMVIDSDDNIFLTGYTEDEDAPYYGDILTLKYTTSGSLAWEKRYASEYKNDDKGVAIALDADGHVFVTGKSRNKNYDIVTIEYDSSGQELSIDRYVGPEMTDEDVCEIACSPQGYVYVAGLVSPFSTWHDYLLIRYSLPNSAVRKSDPELIETALLGCNYPNPFNGATTIPFCLDKESFVTIDLYDLQGRSIKTLSRSFYESGVHLVSWDGRDYLKKPVTSGVYVCKMQAGTHVILRKLSLVR
ncbi:SBBP repeat-containing protein, partial [candidate division KSB1 bacterium]